MTKFFVIRPDEGDVEWVQYGDIPGSLATLNRMLAAHAGDGDTWDPPVVRLVREGDHDQPLRRVPLPWLDDYALVMRDEAIEPMGAILARHGDVRPLAGPDDAALTIFIPPWIDSALDESKSVIEYLPSGGIMRLKQAVFFAHAEQHGAFRLAEFSRGGLYFREDVVRELLETGLVDGTHFAPA